MFQQPTERRAGWLVPFVAVTLASALPTVTTAQSGMNTTSLQHSIVMEGLDNPWDMAFLEDGTLFFTEKCQGLSVRMPSGEVNNLLGMSGSEGYPRIIRAYGDE